MARALRILLAITILGSTLWFIHDRFFVVSAPTAVLAGRTTTLRAPIDGRLDMPLRFPGEQLAGGSILGTVTNERADTRRLAELRTTIATVEGELAALERRAEGTNGLREEALVTAEAFRRTRMNQIAARLAEAEALLRVAESRLREANGAAARGQSLTRQGFTTPAAMDVLRRDLDVARDNERAAAERRDALRVEQAGAVAGIFATDNATDRSISQQTMDRLTLTLVEVGAMIAERRVRLPALWQQAEREERLLALNLEGPVRVPASGVITRIQAQAGEMVRAGQEIARLTACSEPILTAELDERSMRSVQVGQRAEFRPSGGGRPHEAEVIQIIPLSLATGEARTRPQALLRIPALADSCETGRMGEVRFLR